MGMNGWTLRLGRYFGINLRVMPDSTGKKWLCGVIWYPRGTKRLGYLYPSIRFGGWTGFRS
jgi:hypothetical protein